MKFVLFSDLHLDSAFAWLGARDQQAARNRRLGLRDTLRRIVRLAQDEHADALLCGGDLYEHERFSPDTAQFLRATFADAAPLPVYIAPGNHDWFGPSSLYAQTAWSPNVHLFTEDRMEPRTLADGLTLWGAAHRAPANTDNFLRNFQVDRGGVHLALFHGSEQGAFAFQESGKAPHAPFSASEIAPAGLHHAFLGHFHRPNDAALFTYPGNPDPLSFGEDGRRGAVVATVAADGTVTRERRTVASTAVHDVQVGVTDCTSLNEIGERVRSALAPLGGLVRVTLEGALGDSVELRLADLQRFATGVDAAVFRLGNLVPPYDIPRIAQEPTVRGHFVQDVLSANLPDQDRQGILLAGLRALDGRSDLDIS